MAIYIPNVTGAAVDAAVHDDLQAQPESGHWRYISQGALGPGVTKGLEVTVATATTVNVAAGRVINSSFAETDVTTGTLAITGKDPSGPRFDIVVVNISGVKAVRIGTAGSTPCFPLLSGGDIPLAVVFVPQGAGAVSLTAAFIYDLRFMIRGAEDGPAGYQYFREQAAGPSTNPPANHGALYGLDVGGVTHPFWEDQAGTQTDLLAGGGGVTDHGALTGLDPDDDHGQYVAIDGRALGQTIIGGTGSGEDLTLQSTAHATKGTIIADDGFDLNNAVYMTRPISVGISADQTDYAPANHLLANVMKISPDANWKIYSLQGNIEGRTIEITNSNTSGNTLTLVHDDGATGTAAMRFLLPRNRDVILRTYESARIWWDSVTQRWRLLAVAFHPSRIHDEDDDTYIETEASADEDVVRMVTAGTERTTIDAVGRLLHKSGLELSGTESPTWGATVNSYAPADNVVFVRAQGSVANIDITGIVARDNRLLFLFNRNNVAGNTFTLKHENAGSTGVDRFALPGGADVVINSRETVILYYSPSDQKWIVLAKIDRHTLDSHSDVDVSVPSNPTKGILLVGGGTSWDDLTWGTADGQVLQRNAAAALGMRWASDDKVINISVRSPSAADDIVLAHFFNNVTVHEVEAVVRGSGTPSITIHPKHDSDRSAGGTALLSAATAITNTTTGQRLTSFTDATIGANEYLWLEYTAVSSSPNIVEELFLSIRFSYD